ncbi:signal transduction histidine kinase [Rivularia sp. PCC 7116]|uniref:response regulator n=1 Tax=Rivularia sp. PCC 7116 TaxID=373994 RepID=UPI00029ED1EC|nr:response regulator [Rivularia sp. PCC 7116]AFY53118.1 signal transduction histidine kinase [Rivularia sp. PCC 7116]
MKIKNKIIFGYLLALTIALLGTGTGLVVGNNYQHKVLQARQTASKERKFLSRLQVGILYNRITKQLTPHLQDKQAFRREGMELIERIDKIQTMLTTYNQSSQPLTLKGLQPLLEDYKVTVAKFRTRSRSVVDEVDTLLITSPDNKEKAEKLVVNLAKSREFADFVEIADKLTKFYELAEKQESLHETHLIKAEQIRTRIIILSMGISIAIGVIIAVYISRTIAYPIQTLNKIALQVTEEDNFTLQSPIETKDEVGLLAASFNQLIYRVNQLLQERQIYTEKLEYTKEAADAANQAKSEFLANMSHELRTPLNGILGYAQILKRSNQLQEKEHRGAQIIYQCASHLLTLINDILDISKIEARKLELEFQQIHFPSFLETVIEIFRVQAEQKGIDFIYEPDKNLPVSILADEKRLRQVLINLLNNAIKFTVHGSVTFTVKCTNFCESTNEKPIVSINFQIEDTGIGIAENEQTQIFGSFEQVGDKKQQSEGTGLGLAISQRIVELMGSKIQVESQLGLGSAFSFELSFGICDNWTQNISQNHQGQIVGYSDVPRRILVVDDLWENRSVLIGLLEPLGFKLTETQNGKQALLKAKQQPFDLIITDIMMPEMDGFEMLKHLRNDSQIKHIKVIIASASVSDMDRMKSLDAGADDFLPKPINFEDLLEIIAKHLKLTWKYETTDDIKLSSTISKDDAEEILPAPEDLQKLLQLTQDGSLSKILKAAEEIAQQNSQYLLFTEKIMKLAKQCELEEMEKLLQQSLHVTAR